MGGGPRTGDRILRVRPLPLLALLATAAAAGELRAPPPQTEADEYTRYELLAVERGRFRITYEVTATTEGARVYWNSLRKGSSSSDEAAFDPADGRPLRAEVVTGQAARAAGHVKADLEGRYLQVHLPRPVPAGGGVRLRIEKTYADPKSYHRDGTTLVFARSLGIRRNAVVLPAAHELVSCNVPAQVLREADGRIVASFVNVMPGEAALVLRARKLP